MSQMDLADFLPEEAEQRARVYTQAQRERLARLNEGVATIERLEGQITSELWKLKARGFRVKDVRKILSARKRGHSQQRLMDAMASRITEASNGR